ncbi:Crp/Fnr family transcriptional regulator [Erythrobacter insulae]|nr:Crp/Fnr family transcriptional regulator [Erythrobacter insulae]
MPADAGETLFVQSEACESLCEIRCGIARAIDLSRDGERQVMAFFFPGDFLGLPLTIGHRFSAEAVGPLMFARHSSAKWQAELASPSQANANWASEAIWREEKAFMMRGLILGRVGALARVSAFLDYVMPRLPRDGQIIEFSLPQADIASYLALSPETVCRTLKQLREHRVIAMPRKNRLIMQRADQLAMIAQGTHI